MDQHIEKIRRRARRRFVVFLTCSALATGLFASLADLQTSPSYNTAVTLRDVAMVAGFAMVGLSGIFFLLALISWGRYLYLVRPAPKHKPGFEVIPSVGITADKPEDVGRDKGQSNQSDAPGPA